MLPPRPSPPLPPGRPAGRHRAGAGRRSSAAPDGRPIAVAAVRRPPGHLAAVRRQRGILLIAVLAAAVLLLPSACGPADVPNLDNGGSAIVAFGDSITAGVGARPEESYPAQLAALLGVPVVNQGVPGDTSADGLARVERVLAADPWLVIVELGGNDLLRRRPVEAAEADLAAIVEGLLAAGTAVVLVEMEAPLVGRSYAGLFDRLGERFGVPVVEDELGDVLADPSRKSDQIHPNAAGYRDLARAVAEVVAPLVERRREMGLPVAPSVEAAMAAAVVAAAVVAEPHASRRRHENRQRHET